jgi:membrane peptidoglycan carboxypeptidase
LIREVKVSPVPLPTLRRDHHPFTNATSLLVCGLLAGLMVAAAAFPAVAMSGLAAKAGSQEFAELPSELKQQTTPQFSRIYAADGKTQLAVMYDELRMEIPLKDMGVNVPNAIVAAEDRKFFEHNGVDFKGVARAMVRNQQGGSQQGASTLTMQVVRMSLAYSATSPQEVVDATKKTTERKVTEMKYAIQLEKELSKQQILERYLNMAPFGNRAYGVYAASQVYFNKKPKDLTVAEAATLAGLVRGPTLYDPTTVNGNRLAVQRRNYVVDGMLELHQITAAQATEAKKAKLSRNTKQVGNGCAAVAKNEWGFY